MNKKHRIDRPLYSISNPRYVKYGTKYNHLKPLIKYYYHVEKKGISEIARGLNMPRQSVDYIIGQNNWYSYENARKIRERRKQKKTSKTDC